jgi:two-component system, autoinducer 1 sensor kinase/phosphatase LuxN
MNTQGHSRPVILCADDKETEIQRELFRRVLEIAGYTVLIARNAHNALEIFRKNHVDLVLTEHIVPASTGSPTLAATMKKMKPDVPVAIYSADWAESPEDMRFADMFITKLVSVNELLRTIMRLLDKLQARAAA